MGHDPGFHKGEIKGIYDKRRGFALWDVGSQGLFDLSRREASEEGYSIVMQARTIVLSISMKNPSYMH